MTVALQVIVLADEPTLRDQLVAQVAALADCDIAGAGAGDEEDASAGPADVAVWDLGADPSHAREQLARRFAGDVPLVILGPAGLASEAVFSGARGYLRRGVEGPRLRAALQAAAEGLQVQEPARGAAARVEAAVPEDLTARETEVLQLLAEGLPNKEIARRLRISEHTVKFHVNTILAKLGAQTRTEAVTRAARQGLIIL